MWRHLLWFKRPHVCGKLLDGKYSGFVNSYRHRSPGAVTYVFQRYPHGSTSGTTTTPGKMPENEPAMSGSSVWPRQGGSHASSTQRSFHVNSNISSGIILTGYRTPRRQSSVRAPKKLIPMPCQKSHGRV